MNRKNRKNIINKGKSTLMEHMTPNKKSGLSVGVVDDYLKFMIFLALIGVAYIWNSHQAEKQIKLMEAYQKSVKSLKSNYLLKESTLSAATRLSEISSLVDTIGLKELRDPAFRIVRNAEIVKESKTINERDAKLKLPKKETEPIESEVQASR